MTPHEVLLLSSDDDGSMVDVRRALTAAGHRVHTCHEPGAPAFPCAGLQRAGCPIKDGAGVDVVVDVRQHPWPRPTPLEDGVTCALRHRIPVVVAGRTVLHPFDGWATVAVDGTDRVVEACEEAVAARLAGHREAVVVAVAEVLDHAGIDDVPLDAVVSREGGRLRVELRVSLPEGRIRTLAAARAGVALRRLDPDASAIEISFAG